MERVILVFIRKPKAYTARFEQKHFLLFLNLAKYNILL